MPLMNAMSGAPALKLAAGGNNDVLVPCQVARPFKTVLKFAQLDDEMILLGDEIAGRVSPYPLSPYPTPHKYPATFLAVAASTAPAPVKPASAV